MYEAKELRAIATHVEMVTSAEQEEKWKASPQRMRMWQIILERARMGYFSVGVDLLSVPEKCVTHAKAELRGFGYDVKFRGDRMLIYWDGADDDV